MIRFWLDDVGDGLLFGTIGVTVMTSALALLANLPDDVAALAPAATPEVVDEVREISVAMLPLAATVVAEVAEPDDAATDDHGETADEPADAPPLEAEPAREPIVLASAAPAGSAAAKPTRKRRPCDADADPGIQKTGPASWTIDRAVVQRYTRDWGRLDELGWSERHRGPDGKPDGMRIGGVRCGSDLHDAGLRAGDVVHAVNGREVHGIPDAILVYAKVKNDPVIEVDVTRRGERRTLTYRFSG